MSEPTTGSKSKTKQLTRVIFKGNSGRLSCAAYTAIKYVVQRIKDATTLIHEPSIVYELRPDQVLRPHYDDAKYFIEVDEEGTVTDCLTERRDSSVAHHTPHAGVGDFHGIVIHRNNVTTSSLVIKEKASFCDVTVYTCRVVTTCAVDVDGHRWTYVFSEGYKCPSTSGVLNTEKVEKLFFLEPPIHEIEVLIDGW